ncbi:MAG: hypothetical protein U1F76_04695 [Candidatus Competibacteraceae bacterium]
MLDSRQQEALVWGIGRFIAAEPGRHLDLPATVDATARRGGILTVRHQRASYQREVWLWLDETVEEVGRDVSNCLGDGSSARRSSRRCCRR